MREALIEMTIGVAIGAITFTGSIIAFLKLDGRMSGKPIMLPQRHMINIGLAGALLAAGRHLHRDDEPVRLLADRRSSPSRSACS